MPLTFHSNDLRANDSSGPSESSQNRTVTSVTGTADTHGTVDLVNGEITYEPAPDFFGQASFDYTITDNGQSRGVDDFKSATGSVIVTVTEVNDAVILLDDTRSTPEGVTTNIGSHLLLANDSPGPLEDYQLLSITDVHTHPETRGSVSMTTGGANVFFMPEADFFGDTWFTYDVTDNGTTNGVNAPATGTATVYVTVSDVNDPPVAGDDTKTTPEDTDLVFNRDQLLLNDNPGPNEEFQTLTVSDVHMTAQTHGTVEMVNGEITYSPADDFYGDASFTYTLTDNGETNGVSAPQSTTGTVNVTVTEVNDTPIPADDTKSIAEDGMLTFAGSQLLVNDSPGPNEASQSLAVDVVTETPETHGTVSLETNGDVIYTPVADFYGTATFTYTVLDNGKTNATNDFLSATATVTVNVTEVNDAPVPADDTRTVAEDGDLVFNASELLANDSPGPNESSQTLLVTDVTPGSETHGTVQLENGSITYSPALDFFGEAWFTYTVEDNGKTDGSPAHLTAQATVSVTVTEVNDVPQLQDDTATSPEDTWLVIPVATLLANDSAGPGESGQTLTLTAVTNSAATHGQATYYESSHTAANGTSYPPDTIIYIPDEHFNGAASFTYTVTDDGTTNGVNDPRTAVATVLVNVTEVNDAPIAADDSGFTTAEELALTIPSADLLPNDLPGGGETEQTLTVTAVQGNDDTHGDVQLDLQTGIITYEPEPQYIGPAQFTYTVTDNGTTDGTLDAKTDEATVFITVTPVNDPPTIDSIDNVTVDEDAALQTIILTGVTAGGGEDQVLKVEATADVPGLFATLDVEDPLADGTAELTYLLAEHQNGEAVITVTVTDGGNDNLLSTEEDNATVTTDFTITVRDINDAPVALPDFKDATEDVPITFSAADLLVNDAPGPNDNEDHQSISVSYVAVPGSFVPGGGGATMSNGMVTYSPPPNHNGIAIFTYNVLDNGKSDGVNDFMSTFGTVTVNVASVNDPPTVDPVAPITMQEDASTRTINLTGITAGGGENQTLKVDVSSDAPGLLGEVTRSYQPNQSTGTVTFTPEPDQNGVGTITVTVTDAGPDADFSTTDDNESFDLPIVVTVIAVNDAPWTTPNELETVEDTSVQFHINTFLADDTPGPENESSQTLSGYVWPFGGPLHGDVVSNGNGFYTYTPLPNFFGEDSFQYVAKNNGTPQLETGAFVTVDVKQFNDPPKIDPFTPVNQLILAEDAPLQTVSLTGISAGNAENQPLRVTATTDRDDLIGDLSVSYTSPQSIGNLHFKPVNDAYGQAFITVQVTDGGVDEDLSTEDDNASTSIILVVHIQSVNDAPKSFPTT